MRFVAEEICGLAVEQDGVEFREETIEIQRIKEDAEYEGARVRLTATLAKAMAHTPGFNSGFVYLVSRCCAERFANM